MGRAGLIISTITALSVSACSTTEKPQPAMTKQERDAIGMAYIACLHEQARKLDDRRSDAATVALAVEGACAEQSARYRETFTRNMNPQARLMFEAKFANERRLDVATQVVLEERAR